MRSLVAPYFAELRRVKTELNLLKSTPFAININGGASIEKTPAESGVTDVIAPSAMLGQQELSAIEQFLDQRWQRKNGFKPNNYGQLVTAKALPEGYPVTPIALTDAINKLRGGKRVAAT